MTHDELFALPDMTPQFGREERVIDGQRVIVPIAPAMKAMWMSDPGDGMYVDAFGSLWMVGKLDGIRGRQRTGYWRGGEEVTK